MTNVDQITLSVLLVSKTRFAPLLLHRLVSNIIADSKSRNDLYISGCGLLGHFECIDGGCVPDEQVLDGKKDCRDGSDEGQYLDWNEDCKCQWASSVGASR